MTDATAPDSTELTRRDFLSTGLKLGAAVLVAPYVARAQTAGRDTLNVALIGCGEQGRVLLLQSRPSGPR